MSEKIIYIADSITVSELAEKINLPVTKLIGELFKNGIVATINQRIDFDTATIIIEELGIDDVELKKKQSTSLKSHHEHQLSDLAVERPPIVAVMGHVDHGKTTLLDSILKTKVAAGEAGGITQYISAYQTKHNNRDITLLDTPGHEAFAALRQHSAELTDVVVIVVAADDGVKPQTVEAINFAKSANAKIIIAINKMDKPGADSNLVKSQLAEYQLVPEEWGGDTVMVEVSAKTGMNIDKLLDVILLVSDMEELKADINIPAEGLVIESHMETGRGPVVSLLVKQGIIKQSDFLIAGKAYGKIRTLLNYKDELIKQAGPSMPVTITGFKSLPQFGDSFEVVKSEKDAKRLSMVEKIEQEKNAASTNITGSDLLRMMNQKQESQDLNIIVKADVQGSLTSVIDSLKMIDTNGEVIINIVSSGVGNISENDIRLAADKGTIIYGFNIDMLPAIKKMAIRDGIEVKLYKIIYQLIDDARQMIEDKLPPKVVETEIGKLTVKGIFRTTRDELIVGGEVTSGKVQAGLLARIFRNKEQIAESKIEHVQRQQQEAKEVFEGEMCGLSMKTPKKITIEEGDKLELFTRELVRRKL